MMNKLLSTLNLKQTEMDIEIKKKGFRLTGKQWIYAAMAVAVTVVLIIAVYGNRSSVMRIDRESVTTGEVIAGEFNDYIRVVGQVQPVTSLQLSPEEGGIVEQIFLEEGATVKKGEPIVKLRNSNLDLEILNAEANLAEKQNFLRNTQVTMEQDKLNNQTEKIQLQMEERQKKRTYEQYQRLYKEDLVSKEDYLKAKEDYELTVEKRKLVDERLKQDELYRTIQITQLEDDLENMRRSLAMIRERRDKLTVCAPIDGELGMLDVEPGQNVISGQMIGRINVLTGHKIEADIDEHYIDRVVPGLEGRFERQDSTYMLRVKKVYPDVRENKFQTDFEFAGKRPDNIRTGQSYYINLQLGEPTKSVMLPRGTFFNETGGTWIFVLDKDGDTAHRRSIKIGRQNPQYYEVVEGLNPGEKVVLSGYEMFKNCDELILK